MTNDLSARIESARMAHESTLDYYAKYKPAAGQKTMEEHWVTIHSGDQGGGTHVQVDKDGNITAGPAALAEKGIKNLSDFGKPKAAPKESHQMTKAEWAKDADEKTNAGHQGSIDEYNQELTHLRSGRAARNWGENQKWGDNGEKKAARDAELQSMIQEKQTAMKSGRDRSLDESIHRDKIEDALKAGKSVPPEVLADYPDLVKKPEAAATGTHGRAIKDLERQKMEWESKILSPGVSQAMKDVGKIMLENINQRISGKPEPEQHNPTKPPIDKDKLEGQRQMYLDNIDTKKGKGEPIPQSWLDGLANITDQLKGNEPAETGLMASNPVFGHPESTSDQKYANLIPIRVGDRQSIERKRVQAQRLLDELQTKIGQAEFRTKGVRSRRLPALAKEAKRYLESDEYRTDVQNRDSLRNETLPELQRLDKAIAAREPKMEHAGTTNPYINALNGE